MLEGDLFQESGASESRDVKSSLKKYLRYWYLFVLGVVLCVGVAYVYLRYTIPQYQSTSTLLLKNVDSGYAQEEAAVFSDISMFNLNNTIDNEIITLSSKALMHRVLTELALYTQYYREGKINDIEVYGKSLPLKVTVSNLEQEAFGKRYKIRVLSKTSFDLVEDTEDDEEVAATYAFGQEIAKPGVVFTVTDAFGPVSLQKDDEIIVKFNDINSLASKYSSKISITQVNKNTTMLTLSLKDPVREKGVDILNKLMEVYEKEAFEDKNLIVSNSIQFIDDRLKYLTAEITDVEKDVENFKKQNKLTDVAAEANMYSQSANDYHQRLIEHDTQIEILNSIENYIKKQGENQFELVPTTLNISDPTLSGLVAKFNELQLERQRMVRAMPLENPLVINVNEQLIGLKGKILENLKIIRRGLNITRQSIVANSTKFQAKKEHVPAMERELMEINRQQGVKSGLYLYLLQKREELGLSLATTSSNSRVIERAEAGKSPVSPNHQTTYLMALLAGLLLPFSFVFVKEMLNNKVREKREVELVTGTPILGEICINKEREFLVVKENSRSAIAEMFRHMRTNLQFATVGKENKVIMVTSSASGEGKTFFTVNLAASLGLTGKRVVVLEMDLRQPMLLHELGMEAGEGITNYLVSDNVSVNDIVVPSPALPNLYVVGAGTLPPNPAELMMSTKVEKLLNILKESFDHILIDTAPVGLVSDAYNLSAYIDSTIYMIRYNYTTKAHVEIINDIYKFKKLKHPMIVLNGAKLEAGYSYGYGYMDEKKKRPSLKV